MIWVAALLACDVLESACSGVGFDAASCSEPATPIVGPWLASVPGDASVCGLGVDALGAGWSIDHAEAGFTLAVPDGATADCTIDASAFACAPATGPEGTEVLATGTLTSRSTGQLSLSLTSDTCTEALTTPFSAAWRVAGSVTGEHGTCPSDYGDFDQGDGPAVAFTIENRSALQLGLYTLTDGSEVYSDGLDPGEVLDFGAPVGSWFALATDWGEDACVWAFEVESEGHYEVYDPAE